MENSLHNSQEHNAHSILKFVIEGRTFTSEKQFITGTEIREMANLPAGDLYLQISDPWKDDKIEDEELVDLARPGIEQFFIRRPLKYIINGQEYSSNSQFVRGARIREQGNISHDDNIFLIIAKPWEDEIIEDDTWINLARPGIEKFESRPIQFSLIVNAKPKTWNKKRISFKEVVILHYGSFDPNPQISYSVTYKHGPNANPEGIMSSEQTLLVKNKMSFHVSRTNQS